MAKRNSARERYAQHSKLESNPTGLTPTLERCSCHPDHYNPNVTLFPPDPYVRNLVCPRKTSSPRQRKLMVSTYPNPYSNLNLTLVPRLTVIAVTNSGSIMRSVTLSPVRILSPILP